MCCAHPSASESSLEIVALYVCVCVSTIDGKGSSPSKTSLSPNAVKIVCANAVKQLIALIMMRCPW